LIKEECTSELLRFTIRPILNQLRNDQIYHYLEQEQQEQKKAQNNQQQLVNPVNLQPTTAGHHHAPKLYQTSNLETLKPTTSSSISLLPTKTNVPYNIGNLSNEYLETKVLKSVGS
jgi:hypothetical protein